ncbi:MAG: TonB family protein [bacterium]|nr:TonB family protein [bacterium]
MTALALRLPNEGHLGGFGIRQLLQRHMSVGLIISVLFHVTALGTYYLALQLAAGDTPPPVRLVSINVFDFLPPPISGKEPIPLEKFKLPQVALPIASVPKPVSDDPPADAPVIPNQNDLNRMLQQKSDSLLSGDPDAQYVFKEPVIADEQVPEPGTFVSFQQAPQVVNLVQPQYPEIAKKAAVGGRVVLQIYVDKRGDVKDARVVQVWPENVGFEDAAKEAIMKSKFTPALQQHEPVGVWVAYTYNFKVR